MRKISYGMYNQDDIYITLRITRAILSINAVCVPANNCRSSFIGLDRAGKTYFYRVNKPQFYRI